MENRDKYQKNILYKLKRVIYVNKLNPQGKTILGSFLNANNYVLLNKTYWPRNDFYIFNQNINFGCNYIINYFVVTSSVLSD